ncbi:hypothetical protein AVEN_185291-1 [Araneus ventricosus]|uniref:Uncharacterized protein n=1 Tax=Araneus ventricosus TaxID=182803 RepID=A0A4Y2J8K7_ARAVE|nr:hypothetical protein AVEN_43892-1 [Araneus ventricosus]GBM85909.1 hypothetical protein AVEN_56236-1 [Araneus ventricosus]GBM85923.1 hypothetical protein AVEN_110927-1 [Araneus ventricosus]GBM85948.1 hypothetical protein AVEN_185291-1 [Araneus ventricosus]
MIVKRPQSASRHGKMILMHENASRYMSNPVKNLLKDLDVFPGKYYPTSCFRQTMRSFRFSLVPGDGPHTVSTELLNVLQCGPMNLLVVQKVACSNHVRVTNMLASTYLSMKEAT